MIKNEDVARTLKRLRGSRTQAQCAREGGLSANAWTHYEKGRRLPGDELSAKLAKGLGVTLAKLEEEILVSRNERMREEEKAREAETVPRPAGADDPYQRAVREGLDIIHREIEKILLLVNPHRGQS
ncbi:MAG: helix-turn-helix domain-containing protein [Thermoanaerobaculia bacterium]